MSTARRLSRCVPAGLLALAMEFVLALPAGAEPLTAHLPNDDFLGQVTVGDVAEGRIGDVQDPNEPELVLTQDLAIPIRTANFTWVNDQLYNWTLSYEPETFGGVVEFDFGSGAVVLDIPTATNFNSFYVRTEAVPGTTVRVQNLKLGPPPSRGGGGSTIYETGQQGVAASSVAKGDGSGFDVLRITNVNLLDGFTLSGTARLIFAGANPPAMDSDLSFRVYVAVSPLAAGGAPDRDGDLIPDSEDNCPDDPNPAQADFDDDGVGDLCDNCRFAFNPGQEDDDNDGAGRVCDNCPVLPVKCTKINPPTGTCANDQADFDGDGVGDRCDNCRFVPNPGQENDDGDLEGDACDDNTIVLDVAELPPGPGPGGGGGASGGAGGQAVTTIDLLLDCIQNIQAANIGLMLTDGVGFGGFAGCAAPTGVCEGGSNDSIPCDVAAECPDGVCNLDRLDCTDSTPLGPDVDVSKSYVLGKGISSRRGAFPADMVILRLSANSSGPQGGLLCRAPAQDVFLGTLSLVDYPSGRFNPLSDFGFEGFIDVDATPGSPTPVVLTPLVAPSGPVGAESVVFRVNSTTTEKATLELNPYTQDGDRRYQVVLNAQGRIARIAWGMISAGSTAADMVFEGCDVAVQDDDYGNLRACTTQPTAGSFVNFPTDFAGNPPVYTHTVGPNPQPENTPIATVTRLADTLYVGVDSFPGLGVNGTGGSHVLGVVSFTQPTPPPQLTFDGANSLMGFTDGEGGVVQGVDPNLAIEDLDFQNVTLINSFSVDGDADQDGVPDGVDTCVLVPNGGPLEQADSGGVAFRAQVDADPPVPGDGIGDFCTCGDVGVDGIVDNGDVTGAANPDLVEQNDVLDCQQIVAGMEADASVVQDCKVQAGGDMEVPNIVDLLVLELETNINDPNYPPTGSGIGDARAGALQSCSEATGL